MRGRDNGYSDGGFRIAVTVLGGAMVGMGYYDDNSSFRMAGMFIATVLPFVKYSAIAGRRLVDYVCKDSRTRRFEKVGRNLDGRYLSCELDLDKDVGIRSIIHLGSS